MIHQQGVLFKCDRIFFSIGLKQRNPTIIKVCYCGDIPFTYQQRSLIYLSIGQTLARRDRTGKIVIPPSGYVTMRDVSVGKVAMIWN